MRNTLVAPLTAWYARAARDLPWRAPGVSPWGVLVSEIMLQQTPAVRVEPVWRAWLDRWPSPADLADASPAEAIRAWGRLGYPRRALRLHEAARVIVDRWDGVVPSTLEALRGLPGVGEYTAAAVAVFAYRRRALVLDTNIRRVIARCVTGVALPPPVLGAPERALAGGLLPRDPAASVRWTQAAMELGALVCTSRAPACQDCPLLRRCRWRRAGRPGDPWARARRPQGYEGTDRQARGAVLACLRETPAGVPEADVLARLPRPDQARRAVESLVADGLAIRTGDGRLCLPG
ncbi:MAG: A/G-specific adenine glycosylase [Actinomycetia bacterium]|nr:A/G-specific adenine glycosylase [Actinomycetes bacterium]